MPQCFGFASPAYFCKLAVVLRDLQVRNLKGKPRNRGQSPKGGREKVLFLPRAQHFAVSHMFG